ncbi:MAG TPA: flavodoxin domain-containing protein [Methanomassiliicoccales archaeon]|nr:flavodoxin domain-containing protein [Methanomassiliicoccales archaeon]
MKCIVVYDSVYGNTKQVAEAIADQIKADGNEIALVSLRENTKPVLNGDIMFLGSPTRVFKMTPAAKNFVKGLKTQGWKDQPIVMFDTMMGVPEDMAERSMDKWAVKGAAPKLRDLAKSEGLNAQNAVLHIGVTGLKGPLTVTGKEEARQFAQQTMASLKK